MMRRPILAANWKMQKTNAEAKAFASEFKLEKKSWYP